MTQFGFFEELPEQRKPEKVKELPSKEGFNGAGIEKNDKTKAEPVIVAPKPELKASKADIIAGFGDLPEQRKPESEQRIELAKIHGVELKPKRKKQKKNTTAASPHDAEIPEAVKKSLAEKANNIVEYPAKPAPEEQDMKQAEYLAKAETKKREEKRTGVKAPPSEQALHVQALMIEYKGDSLTRRRKAQIEEEIFRHFDKMLDGMGNIYGRKFGKDPEELYIIGKVGLMKAMENFDPERDGAAKFPHYATVSARRLIKATVMKMNGLSTQGERHLFFNIGRYENRIKKFKKEFTEEERDLIIARLLSKRKRKTGKSKGQHIVSSVEHGQETLANFRAKMKKGHTTSLNESLHGDNNKGEIIDTIIDKNALTGDEHIIQKEEAEVLARDHSTIMAAYERAIASLSDKQRVVLQIRRHMRPTEDGGERPKFTHKAIAEQIGVSEEAIRQREKSGLANFSQKFQEILISNRAAHLYNDGLKTLFGQKAANENEILESVLAAEQNDMSEYCASVDSELGTEPMTANIVDIKPPKKDGGECYQAFTSAKAPIVLERRKKRKLNKPPANYSANHATMAIAAE